MSTNPMAAYRLWKGWGIEKRALRAENDRLRAESERLRVRVGELEAALATLHAEATRGASG